MSEFTPLEKGVSIRYPSTANLMIDSNDRNITQYPVPWDFVINKNNSILNGFFTRIGVAEVVLNWNIFNVQPLTTGITFTITKGGTTHTASLGGLSPSSGDEVGGFFTVADALNAICAYMNGANAFNDPGLFEIVKDPATGIVWMQTSDGSDFIIVETPLMLRLGFNATDGAIDVPGHQIYNPPNLLPFRYIDIVSTNLTYNQELKDATTSTLNRDVLCRWYFANDNVPQALDVYGFPIYQGYTAFYIRRLFNPAKQVRWQSNMPIGQLDFQVYTDDGALVTKYDTLFNESVGISDPVTYSGFLMTLQVSEV